MQFDTSKSGLFCVLRDYGAMLLERFLEMGSSYEMDSREAWIWLNREFARTEPERTISRASVINMMQDMAGDGFLERREKSGKGGYRGVYRASLSRPEVEEKIVETIVGRLQAEWPESLERVLKGLGGGEG